MASTIPTYRTIAIGLALLPSALVSLVPSVEAASDNAPQPASSFACNTSGCTDQQMLDEWEHYDPSTCREDAHDKFFIALGRNVLGVAHTGSVMLGAIYPGMKDQRRYPAPEPTDPEGCPGNPLQLESFAYEYWMDGVPGAKSEPMQKTLRPDALELISIVDDEAGVSPKGAEWAEWEAPQWMGERMQLSRARRTCQDAAIREQLPNGLMACQVRAQTPVPRYNEVENWAASYIADCEIYKAPLGERFVVDCDPGLFSDSIGHCAVSYVMVPQIGLTYRFQPYLGEHPIPIDEIIAFDRGLRATIEAALVKNYRWQDQRSQ